MVTVYSVEGGSKAEKAGILPGDILISVCGEEINDVLDYRFYLSRTHVRLKIHRGSELFDVDITKGEYDDIGLEFETYLMDKKRTCRNKCIFCFIDQMPKGCRETLYFKDDDSRLSFLQGNYITCTNLTSKDIDRIIKMRMSPVNISVHTTDPELRVMMMKNKNAGNILDIMRRFASGGILMNAQLVLCRGINDGAQLLRSMRELESLCPMLNSVSAVPCGITDHRQGLYEITPYDRCSSLNVVRMIEGFADECLKKHGRRIFFASDEFYINAGVPFHTGDYYEEYPQLENGVGMISLLLEQVNEELEFAGEYDLDKKRCISIATGKAAYPYIKACCDKICVLAKNTSVNVYLVENRFFGKNITVAGLLTGGDIYDRLKDEQLGDTLLIPSVTLRCEEDTFLDDMTVGELSEKLNIKIVPVISDGAELVKSILY